MDPDIGDCVEPLAGNIGHGVKPGQTESGQKIFFNIAHCVFHSPFFITLSDATRDYFETIVIGEVEISWVKERVLAYDAALLRLSTIIFLGTEPKASKAF